MRNLMRMAIAAAAIAASLGFASPAEAAQRGDDLPGGEAEFKENCANGGGSFYRDRDSGAIRCKYRDGTIIMCDRGAKNCTTHKLYSDRSSGTYTGSNQSMAR